MNKHLLSNVSFLNKGYLKLNSRQNRKTPDLVKKTAVATLMVIMLVSHF